MRGVGGAAVLALLAALLPTARLARAGDDDYARLILQVLTDETKKPVASAHVVVNFVSGRTLFIKKRQARWEAQTNKKGEIIMDDLPRGRVKVQVIARGYQTFGDEYDLNKAEETLTILMKPPAKQVSAY